MIRYLEVFSILEMDVLDLANVMIPPFINSFSSTHCLLSTYVPDIV